jgi:addiction module RelB/DinJ family antitoxin
MANTTIQIRTETQVKERADSIFKRLGITMSDGINIFLRQVNQHGGFPFEVKLGNTAAGDKEYAVKMYAEGKLSLSQASRLCGIDLYDFTALLAASSIPVINYSTDDFEKELDSIGVR